MKQLVCILLFITFSTFGQSVDLSSIKSTKLDIGSLIAVDNFGTTYYVVNNVLYKDNATTSITYNNLQLGELYSVNTFNPLKINLFYKDFNTLIVLDNRLAEIYKVNFNAIQPYKNVAHVTTGFDNTVWIFNTDLQYLQLYDYQNNAVRAETIPVQSEVLGLKSNYNYCWLLTKNYLYKYNYFGSLISKIENDGYTSLAENDGDIFVKKDNNLFYLPKDTVEFLPLKATNLLINDFFVINETLYIYDSEILHEYQLKTN